MIAATAASFDRERSVAIAGDDTAPTRPVDRPRAARSQVMSSMRCSATRAHSAVRGSTVIWLTTSPLHE